MQSKKEVQNIDKNRPSTIYIYRENTFLLAIPMSSAEATGQADTQTPKKKKD